MPKKILIAFASLLGLVLVLGLVLPTTYRVERSLVILAPSELVYAQVAQPRRWPEWTPWNASQYPGGEWMFGGPELGAGSVRSWTGDVIGRGTLSLSEANPRTGVSYQASLDGGRFSARGRISLEPIEGGTRVTWVDEGGIGGHPLRRYLMPLIRSRLGSGFEEGLARLKTVVESGGRGALPPEASPGATPAPPAVEAPPVIAPPSPRPSNESPALEPLLEPGSPPPPLPGDAGVALPPPASEPSPPEALPAPEPVDAGQGDAGLPR